MYITIFAVISAVIIATIIIVTARLCAKNENTIDVKPITGVWWWDNRLDDSYLDFACKNGVTEIYYYASSFTDKLGDFIGKANDKNVRVYWLCGKYEWIEDPDTLYGKIDEFLEFQSESEHKFSGIHFDIEPHQHPDFDSERDRLITAFAELAISIKVKYPNISTAYDIPFWLHDEITINGVIKPAYAFIIDNANSVTVMSYRDSAEAVYECAREETEYAVAVGKTLNLGVETSENEDDIVTFYEEGAEYMNDQISELRKILPKNFGVAVHHIRTWRELST